MAQLYYHRAYYDAGDEYVYWVAEVPYDNGGEYWVGPPPFAALSDIVMLFEVPADAEGAFFNPKTPSTEVLNEFYTPDEV